MIIPRYYFGADYISFEEYLLQECDSIQDFPKGSFLNGTDIDYNTIYYILDGLGQFYILHESGKRSIISIHGYGTIYPLFRDLDGGEYQLKQFKLEGNLFFQAITDMKVAAFSYETMSRLITSNSKFCHRCLRAYLNYINLLLYRVTTSDHDDAEKKVCNYLFSMHYYGKITACCRKPTICHSGRYCRFSWAYPYSCFKNIKTAYQRRNHIYRSKIRNY